MTRTRCPNCNHEIDKKMKECPNCGVFLKYNSTLRGLGKFLCIIGVLFIAYGTYCYLDENHLLPEKKEDVLQEAELKEGEVSFLFSVSEIEDLPETIEPNKMVNIWFQAYDNIGNTYYGRLIRNVRILVAKDENDKIVTKNLNYPETIKLAVSQENYILLNQATNLKDGISSKLILVDNSERDNLRDPNIKEFIEQNTLYTQ